MNESGKMEGEEAEMCSKEEAVNHEDSFIWDDNTQLYYHARSGFYHDPNAGWYYSTRDGFYYKFEDGNYVLFDSYNQDYHSENEGLGESAMDGYSQNTLENEGCFDFTSSELPDNPPPSEWLEDTLIELYLSGYPNTASNAADNLLPSEETVDNDDSLLTTDGNDQKVDSDWSWDHNAATDSAPSDICEEVSWEEESWRAQYGQVVQEEDKLGTGCNTIDMWDWSLVNEMQKEGSCPMARIVGRDWGFPEFSTEGTNEICESKTASQILSQQPTSLFNEKSSVSEKHKNRVYRDRAAERRALHGGFGEGPGQKRSVDDASPPSTQEAAAEALEMSLGTGSYARKILKNMGWKEGEGLGKTQQGLKEPLQGVGNKGTVGLGWKSR